MACLVIVSGEQAGTYFQLTKRTLTGGRDPAREIQIVDAKVSRKHFQIRYGEDHHLVVELQSLNGVEVNGAGIDGEQVLHDGDEIIVGSTMLQFYEDDNPDRTNAVNVYRQRDRRLREDRTITD